MVGLNLLAAAGGAADRYNDLFDAGIKLKAAKAKNAKADTTFTLGTITRSSNPLDETTAANMEKKSATMYQELLADDKNHFFIQMVNDGQGDQAVAVLRENGQEDKADVLSSQIQNFKAIRNQAINYYTDPLKGEGGAIVGNRTIPEYFNADSYFVNTVTSYLSSDPVNFNANIDRTLAAVGLDVTENMPSKTAATAPPVSINFMGQNIMEGVLDPTIEEAPATEETPTVRNWGINYLEDNWRTYNTLGLTAEEAEEWGKSIVEQGKEGRLDNIIALTSQHIPRYLPPEKQGGKTGLLIPAELPLTQSEVEYNKTRSELGNKVLNITNEMYKIILDPENGIGIVGASANWQNLIDRYAGSGGVIDQVYQLGRNIKSEGYVLGTYEDIGEGNRRIESKTREEELKFLNSLGIDSDMTISEHMANINKVGGAARLESLTISLAFAIAIANQDFQGGKAVSDADFRQAYLQVTGGSSQGSLFRGFSKPLVFLSTIKQVRDGLLLPVVEARIAKESEKIKGRTRRTTDFMMKGLKNASASDLVHIIQGKADRFDNLLEDAYNKAKGIKRMENVSLRNLGFGETAARGFFGRANPFGATTKLEDADKRVEERANSALLAWMNRDKK